MIEESSIINDTYLTKIREDMMEYIEAGYDPTGFKHKWVDDVLEGIYKMRQDAGLDDIPMTPAYGLQNFAEDRFENGLYGNFIILKGEKDGYNYEFVFEDIETGNYSGMGLSLYRFVTRYPEMEIFAGRGKWDKISTLEQLDYMDTPEGSILRQSSRGMNDIMEAYRKRYDEHGPSREKCCELYDNHKTLIEIVDKLSDSTSIETRLDCEEDENYYVFTDRRYSEGMIFKDDEDGNVIPCLFFQPYFYKANADDILIDTGYKLTLEEAVDLIRKMEGHKFAFMFDRKEVSCFDYDIFKERKKFLKEIEGLNFTGHAKELADKVKEAFKTIPECDDEFEG